MRTKEDLLKHMSETFKLTPLQQRVFEAVIMTTTVEEAAKYAKVSLSTVRRALEYVYTRMSMHVEVYTIRDMLRYVILWLMGEEERFNESIV